MLLTGHHYGCISTVLPLGYFLGLSLCYLLAITRYSVTETTGYHCVCGYEHCAFYFPLIVGHFRVLMLTGQQCLLTRLLNVALFVLCGPLAVGALIACVAIVQLCTLTTVLWELRTHCERLCPLLARRKQKHRNSKQST